MMKKLIAFLVTGIIAVASVHAAGRVPTHKLPDGREVYTTPSGQLRYVLTGIQISRDEKLELIPLDQAIVPQIVVHSEVVADPEPEPAVAPQLAPENNVALAPAGEQQQAVPARLSFIDFVTSTALGKAIAAFSGLHGVVMLIHAMQGNAAAAQYFWMQMAATAGAYFAYSTGMVRNAPVQRLAEVPAVVPAAAQADVEAAVLPGAEDK